MLSRAARVATGRAVRALGGARWFCAPEQASFAARRRAARAKRLKPGASGAPAAAARPSEGLDAAGYQQQVRRLLGRIKAGLEGMVPLNKGMALHELPEGLQIDVGGQYGGSYRIELNEPERQICMSSPFTGTYLYQFDSSEQAWVSTRDKHRIDELIARELVETAYSVGYPDF